MSAPARCSFQRERFLPFPGLWPGCFATGNFSAVIGLRLWISSSATRARAKLPSRTLPSRPTPVRTFQIRAHGAELSSSYPITVEIGGMPILLHTQDDSFRQMLARRYAGFVSSARYAALRVRYPTDGPFQEGAGRRRSSEDAGWHLAAAARRFSRPVGPRGWTRPDSPVRQPLFHRFGPAHRAHADPGAGRRISAAFRRSHPQWTRISIFRSVRRRQDHDLPARAPGCDTADRRSVLHTPG